MFFQSKKKRLWRARVPQTATHHATHQQQQLQNQHHYQQSHQFQSQRHTTHYHQQQQNQHQQQHLQINPLNPKQSTEGYPEENVVIIRKSNQNSYLGGEQKMIDCQENVASGYCYVSGGGDANVYDDDQTMSSMMSTTSTGSTITTSLMSPSSMIKKSEQIPINFSIMTPVSPPSPPPTTTITSSMAATAANVLLNCCGGGNSSSSSSSGNGYSNSDTNLNLSNLNNNNNNTENVNYMNVNDEKQLFRGLVSKLKESQLTTLCQAVEKTNSDSGGGGGGYQQDCVLVPRGTILGEEPNVIACRLWRWPDIRGPNELKSIPSCPNEKDRIYVCCNPNHWSRLCIPDTPPPPYQVFAMDRLKPEDRAPSKNLVGGIRLQFPESFTTDGEESSTSSTWCQLAYWELAQRVGGRFPVENSSVNVFSDQPQGDGMCLKTLAEQRQSDTPESVLKARQKIGLGVTLSQEADGVWLYNRSLVPVFVHSPTLNDVDYWFHVSKVPPGYCLRAFDSYRAKSQSLVWPPQIAGAQTGPVDTYSMRISFAKGWGPNYSRQDVTACPCWLEVLLTRR